jgi:hypothetical protein
MIMVVVAVVLVTIIVSSLLEFLWHWWKSHTLRQIWKWVNEASRFFFIMVERAAFTELAITGTLPIFAWDCLVVGVNSTESSLAEILWKRIIWLSQIILTVSKLAVLSQWAFGTLNPVFA